MNFLTFSLLRRFASLVTEPDARLRFGELRFDREIDFSDIAEDMVVFLAGLALLGIVDFDVWVEVLAFVSRFWGWSSVS